MLTPAATAPIDAQATAETSIRLATDLIAVLLGEPPAGAAEIGAAIADLRLLEPSTLSDMLTLVPNCLASMLDDDEWIALGPSVRRTMAHVASGYYARAHTMMLDEQANIRTTEALAAEDRRRQSEARYRRLIEASPDTILAHVDGKIVLANHAAAKVLGVESPDDLIGQDVYAYVDPHYIAIHQARRAQLRAGSSLEPVETQIRRTDGTTVALELHTVLTDHDGRRTTLVIGRDITRHTEAKAAVRQAQEELERRVRNRTAELAQANAALERSNAELRALYAIGVAAGKSRGLDGLVGTALDETLALTGVRETWVTIDDAGEGNGSTGIRAAGEGSEETPDSLRLRLRITDAVCARGLPLGSPLRGWHRHRAAQSSAAQRGRCRRIPDHGPPAYRRCARAHRR